VPALVTDGGAVITDSTIISEYFDAVGQGRALIGDDRFEVMARVALMQGLIDAAFAIVIERRRPTERRWDDWVSRQHRAIARTLETVAPADDRFDLGDIALACALCLSRFPLAEDCVAVRAPDTRRMARRGRPPAVDAGDGALKITERDAHSRLRPAQRHGWRGRGRRFGAR
jgi:glutathione S-transferase